MVKNLKTIPNWDSVDVMRLAMVQSSLDSLPHGICIIDSDYVLVAANRAYYAMFHAVQAALATTNVRMPRTHNATITLFSREFVRTGTLDRAHSRNLQDAFDLRQQSD